jgi:hypothetical protein
MRDYSDAPEWATEAFFTKPYEGASSWYYGNEKMYIHMDHIKEGLKPSIHDKETLKIISGDIWWREPLNIIVENE